MAGAGYKLFNTGDVLTAAQVNTYLQEQTVMVFASSAARTSALSGVLAEGMVSYLQDSNVVEVYNGSAWVGVSGAGDVTEVQAGTGISVASGTGPIPVVTNTMATAIDAAGDLIYGTGADTFAKLGIGTAGQVLKVNSGATAPEWAAPAGASKNWSLVNAGGTALTGAATITVSGISGADEIMVLVAGGSTANTGSFVSYRFNGDTGSNYLPAGSRILAANAYDKNNFRNKTGAATTEIIFSRIGADAGAEIGSGLIMSGCNSSGVKVFNVVAASYSSTNNEDSETYILNGIYTGTSTISSVSVISSSGNWDAGTIYVYKTA